MDTKRIIKTKFEGIYTRGNSILMSVSYAGKRKKFTLKGVLPTQDSLKNAFAEKVKLEEAFKSGERDFFSFTGADSSSNKKPPETLKPTCRTLIKDLLHHKLVHYKKRVNDKVQGKKKIKSTTYEDYKRYIEKYLVPTFGHLELNQIDVMSITIWLESLTISAKYFKNIIIPLKSILHECVKLKLIIDNPFSDNYFENLADEILEDNEAEPDPFQEEEIKVIFEAPPSQMRQLMLAGIYSGLRIGELIALRQDNLRLIADLIEVRLQKVRKKIITPKSKNSIRDVTMLGRAKSAFEEQTQLTGSSEYVFLNPNTDEPWTTSDVVNNNIERFLDSLNIKFRPAHQMRHTYASLLLSNGENPLWVSKQMGHRDSELVYKKYGHWLPKSGVKNGYMLVGDYN